MKSNFKTIMGTLMPTAILLIVTITACNKSALHVPDTTELSSRMEAKAQALLNKRKTAGDDHAMYAAIRKEYQALNTAELEVYNALKLKSDSLEVVKEFNGNQVLVNEKVAFLKKLRDEVQVQCQLMYNKNANQVTFKEVEAAIQAAKVIFKPVNGEKQHAKDVEIMACPQQYYPHVTSQATYTRKYQYGWGRGDNAPNWEPCDYEFYFDGVYQMVKDHNVDSWEIMNNYGYQVSKRYASYWDGDDTAILLGYWTVHYYSSGAASLYYSMDYVL